MRDEKPHYGIYDTVRSKFLQTSLLAYTVYFAVLGLLYILTDRMETTYQNYRVYSPWAALVLTLLLVAFMFIVIAIAIYNKGNTSAILIKLSALPLLLIASYVPFVLGIFKNAGSWWILYAALLFGLPLSLILFVIGCVVGFKAQKR